MEKLEAKHNHKLTDILKVAIFGLMLVLPGLILLPSMLYYGVNEHATAPTEQVEKIEYERVNFNQYIDTISLAHSSTDTTEVIQDNGVLMTFDNTATATYCYLLNSHKFNFNANDKYAFRYNYETNLSTFDARVYFSNNTSSISILSFHLYENTSQISTVVSDSNNYAFIAIYLDQLSAVANDTYFAFNFNLFNLTQMFGSGNEPTIEQFNSWYTKDYYNYTESRYEILEKPTGTYETYTDITSQIQYNWNSLWQQPLFSWTNYTILKQGLDNFTYVFGITQTSYINNLIVYELIIVAIYIVIDIVLTLFKWLTHLIGEK